MAELGTNGILLEDMTIKCDCGREWTFDCYDGELVECPDCGKEYVVEVALFDVLGGQVG